MWKKLRIIVINQFGFSQSEANGFIILVLVIILTALLPRIYFRYYEFAPEEPSNHVSLKDWEKELTSSLSKKRNSKAATKRPNKKPEVKIYSFEFDPNRSSKEDLIRLGFKDYVAERIVKFREAGGSFKIKSDLLKIYGIDSVRVTQLFEKIQLPVYPLTEESVPLPDASKKRTITRLDINHCKTEDLLMVPGIGKVFSSRIIKYRDLLGGFYSLDQLGEVYNFPDSLRPAVEEYFYAEIESVQKINLNGEEINRHPYLDYHLIKAIKNYRKIHGDFQGVEEIKNIKLVDDSLFQKLLPYLSI